MNISSIVCHCVDLYRSEPLHHIALIRRGVEAKFADTIIMYIAPSKRDGLRAVDISQATMNRWIKKCALLPLAESERVLGVARMIGQVQAMVEDSGDPSGFDVGVWLGRWLAEPNPSLDGICPCDFLDTIVGQTVISNVLARMQSSSFA